MAKKTEQKYKVVKLKPETTLVVVNPQGSEVIGWVADGITFVGIENKRKLNSLLKRAEKK